MARSASIPTHYVLTVTVTFALPGLASVSENLNRGLL